MKPKAARTTPRKKVLTPRRKSPAQPVASRRGNSGRVVGAHQSIAGGLSRAVERAVETGCHCLQVFTRNIDVVNAVVSGDYDNDISDHKCLKVTLRPRQH
jgi:hypothetical protein